MENVPDIYFQTPALLIHSWVTSVTHEWIGEAGVWKLT